MAALNNPLSTPNLWDIKQARLLESHKIYKPGIGGDFF